MVPSFFKKKYETVRGAQLTQVSIAMECNGNVLGGVDSMGDQDCFCSCAVSCL